MDKHWRMHQPIILEVTFFSVLKIAKAPRYFHNKSILHCRITPEVTILDDKIYLVGYKLHLVDRHKSPVSV